MLVGSLKPDNGKEPVEVEQYKEDFLEVFNDMKAKGWKSESIFYLNGDVFVKITSPTISKVTITGLLVENEKV